MVARRNPWQASCLLWPRKPASLELRQACEFPHFFFPFFFSFFRFLSSRDTESLLFARSLFHTISWPFGISGQIQRVFFVVSQCPSPSIVSPPHLVPLPSFCGKSAAPNGSFSPKTPTHNCEMRDLSVYLNSVLFTNLLFQE